MMAVLSQPDRASAQSQNWSWARSAGGGDMDIGNDIVHDSNGNVYMSGFFRSDSIAFGGTMLFNPNGYPNSNIFVAKYDPSGNALWARSAGGVGVDECYAMAIDTNDNVYISGTFMSPSITFGATTLTNAGSRDIFVAKYSSSGNVEWAQRAGSPGWEISEGMTTDASGNVYLTGSFENTISFGSISLTTTGSIEMFIAKYDPSGNVISAIRQGGVGDDRSFGIAADASGNIYMTGYFLSPTITFGSTTLTSSGSYDLFVVKYNSSGNVVWAKNADSYDADASYGVTADANGSVYISGQFYGSVIHFGTITLNNVGGAGNYDLFIAKYDSSGNVLWAKGAGDNPGQNVGWNVNTDGVGNVYLTGWFGSPTISFDSTTFINAGFTDLFVTKYSPAGNMLWAKSVGGSSADNVRSMTIDAADNLYFTGYYGSPVTFGSHTLTYAGVYDVFLAKIPASSTGVYGSDGGGLPTHSTLLQNYPNPFNPTTRIDYALPYASHVRLTVYNVLGQLVATLVDEARPAGRFALEWNGVGMNGNDLTSGVYFYTLLTDDFVQTKRLMLLK